MKVIFENEQIASFDNSLGKTPQQIQAEIADFDTKFERIKYANFVLDSESDTLTFYIKEKDLG